jgi:FkbM family methyltransferase
MKRILRYIFRFLFGFYKREYGKYTILTKLFFPYLANSKNIIHRTKLLNSFYMDLDVSEYVQAHLFVFGIFESETINFCKKAMKNGDFIFDIGANIGFHTLVFNSLVTPKGKVISFEPEDSNFNKLTNNISINNISNSISLIKKAASDKNETLKLYLAKDNNLGAHSIFERDELSKEFLEIPAIKIDDFVIENKIEKIDFIKIDVEGAEMQVIKGMTETIKRLKPTFIIEFNNFILEKIGSSSYELKNYIISSFSYSAFKILPDGNLISSNLSDKHDCDNVVFIHNEKIEHFKGIIVD